MEPIQEQVTLLTQKVDALHQVVEQVDSRVSEILVKSQSQPESNILDDERHPHIMSSSSGQRGEALLVHKDILMDSAYIDPETSGDDTVLSPEVQIQRLTAQLTAAYNRIAALEEQLLAIRTH
ncbi:hypothetical protein PN498_03430 [Oscillatoria sp. CS-180]|uniref:hypothetical protein n=1 Tax=Oscillatoria sp. CS-180 TaxID=3021720 RepID=UPI00232FD6B8|nr:hypothetical protein [Oscillatoria sp. CS-180]MDB9525028.1 hypothetical protein [Oscillatoria sp. CS-180]